MTTQQENKLRMYCGIREYLEANVKITDGLPEFDKYFYLFQSTIEEIREKAEIQNKDRKGVFLEKNQLRDDLILSTICCANKLRLYAMLKKKKALESEVKLNPSALKRMSDTALMATAKMVYDRSEANFGLLKDFNITRKAQNEFLNLTNSFEESIGKARQVINEKKLATEKLADLFREAERIAVFIDIIINLLMFEQWGFYEGYRRIRKVSLTRNA
jgi:hypothetical protein